MSHCSTKPLRSKAKPPPTFYDIQLIEKFQNDSIAWDQSKYGWAFNVVDGRAVIHTISFKATDRKDLLQYDHLTGKNLLSIPQDTVHREMLVHQITELQNGLSNLPPSPYSLLDPHVAFYIYLKSELLKMKISWHETSYGERLSREGAEVVATMEETTVLVRKRGQAKAPAAPAAPAKVSKESENKEKKKIPEQKKVEKQRAKGTDPSSSDLKAEASTTKSKDRLSRRESDGAGSSNANAKPKTATREKVINIDGSRNTANTSVPSRHRAPKDPRARVLRDLQMTPSVRGVDSSAPKEPDSGRTESNTHSDAAKLRRRGYGEGSEDEGHSSSGEGKKKRERRRRGDKA